MKLPLIVLREDEKIDEFDQWLTPQLQKIKQSDKFSSELLNICQIIDGLNKYLKFESEIDDCSPVKIRDSIILYINNIINTENIKEAEIEKILLSFFSLLFLVTGSSDNNLKNHFLIKLKQDGVDTTFPDRSGRSMTKFKLKQFGNTITSAEIATKISKAYLTSLNHSHVLLVQSQIGVNILEKINKLLLEYICLILSDNDEILQFWAVCSSYIHLKSLGGNLSERLIAPLTIFKVRGSVSASAGHIPEIILREKLEIIGLDPGIDFNSTDVILGEENVNENGSLTTKTRAYDFVIPYATKGWTHKIFIQSQFYAGDSGSVSHKVVDQTVSSRQFTLTKYPDARFVEYMDGAGYFAALRTDLLHMLRMENTHSFFQVRSIFIRLRRELQDVGFLTPIEIEHAILRTKSGNLDEVTSILKYENYESDEIDRAIIYAIDKGYITQNDKELNLDKHHGQIARRLLILDMIAVNGKNLNNVDEINKSFMIPGYGSSFGISFVYLGELVEKEINYQSLTISEYNQDIEWLFDEKVIKRLNI